MVYLAIPLLWMLLAGFGVAMCRVATMSDRAEREGLDAWLRAAFERAEEAYTEDPDEQRQRLLRRRRAGGL
ncbi:MAG TPA: hypothetical protein VGG08_03075 [Solirubrobacteraceae bacterium]